MTINGFNPGSLSQISPNTAGGSAGVASTGSSGSFGSMVRDAIDSVDQGQKAASQEIANAVTGDSPDLHRTIIALQTADLQFQFAMQVRNKLIGAYEEVMRMQV